MQRKQKDTLAMVGVDTMVVFIATILLSTLVMVTIVSVAERVIQTPERVLIETINTGDKILLHEVYVYDGFDNYGLVWELAPGSMPQSAEDMYWILQCTDENNEFRSYWGNFGATSFDIPPAEFSNDSIAEGLLGKYYDVPDRSGDPNPWPEFAFSIPQLIRYDANPNFAGGNHNGVGSVDADWYAISWTGYLYVDDTDTYDFIATVNDRARVWIDDHLVIANGVAIEGYDPEPTIHLARGYYSITIHYEQQTLGSNFELSWSNSTSANAPISDDNYYRSIGSTSAVNEFHPGVIYDISLDQKNGDVGSNDPSANNQACGPNHLYDEGLSATLRLIIAGGQYTEAQLTVNNPQVGTRVT